MNELLGAVPLTSSELKRTAKLNCPGNGFKKDNCQLQIIILDPLLGNHSISRRYIVFVNFDSITLILSDFGLHKKFKICILFTTVTTKI